MWTIRILVIVSLCAVLSAGCQSDPSRSDAHENAQSEVTAASPATQPASPETAVDQLEPDSGNLRAFVELARRDLRLRKAAIIAQNLPLTDDQGAEFWPVQREYEQELAANYDQKLALIEKFFAGGSTLSDSSARALARSAFDIESRRTELKRRYFDRFCKVIPPAKAARFFQLDNQMNMLVDLRIAAALPLIK